MPAELRSSKPVLTLFQVNLLLVTINYRFNYEKEIVITYLSVSHEDSEQVSHDEPSEAVHLSRVGQILSTNFSLPYSLVNSLLRSLYHELAIIPLLVNSQFYKAL